MLSAKETPPESFATTFWQKLGDGRIQCDVCPRECKLKDGQRGLCFVRMNEGGELVLKTYGRSSGFCIDPIEKKPLNHFLPGSAVLSFGTAGCNLFCNFCQNWDISKARKMDRLMNQAMPDQIAGAAKVQGADSVAFTYNDPVIFLEYAVDAARACHEQDIKTVAVTAGYVKKEARRYFFEHIDAANIDLKAFSNDFYQKLCGGRLNDVLDTLSWLREQNKTWFEITTLIIPGENDSEKELKAMTKWVYQNLGADTPLHFSAFHPDFKMLEKEATSLATLRRACEIAQSEGLNYVYTGNVHDREGDTTFCHHCNETLIVRDWYELLEYNLDAGGRCKSCGTACTGVFAAKPGSWGRHRLPITIS